MTTIVKIHRKGQMTLPCRLRSALGIAEGDLVEATVQRGKLVITPKVVIDRSRFPSAQDEYTLPSVAGLTAAFPKARKNTSRAGPFAHSTATRRLSPLLHKEAAKLRGKEK